MSTSHTRDAKSWEKLAFNRRFGTNWTELGKRKRVSARESEKFDISSKKIPRWDVERDDGKGSLGRKGNPFAWHFYSAVNKQLSPNPFQASRASASANFHFSRAGFFLHPRVPNLTRTVHPSVEAEREGTKRKISWCFQRSSDFTRQRNERICCSAWLTAAVR